MKMGCTSKFFECQWWSSKRLCCNPLQIVSVHLDSQLWKSHVQMMSSKCLTWHQTLYIVLRVTFFCSIWFYCPQSISLSHITLFITMDTMYIKAKEYEKKLDTNLSRYKLFRDAEVRTKIPKVYLALGGVFCIFILIFFNVAAPLITNLIGWLYPGKRVLLAHMLCLLIDYFQIVRCDNSVWVGKYSCKHKKKHPLVLTFDYVYYSSKPLKLQDNTTSSNGWHTGQSLAL